MATGNIMTNEERELVLTRVFDAPRELVFKAWTDPSRWHSGGTPTDLRTQSVTWMCGPAGRSAFTCAAPTAPSIS